MVIMALTITNCCRVLPFSTRHEIAASRNPYHLKKTPNSQVFQRPAVHLHLYASKSVPQQILPALQVSATAQPHLLWRHLIAIRISKAMGSQTMNVSVDVDPQRHFTLSSRDKLTLTADTFCWNVPSDRSFARTLMALHPTFQMACQVWISTGAAHLFQICPTSKEMALWRFARTLTVKAHERKRIDETMKTCKSWRL